MALFITREWLPPMIAAGEIYHPLRLQPSDAWRFPLDVPKLEAAGIVVRAPANWPAGRPARPKVAVTVGAKAPSRVGIDALMDFEVSVTLDGEKLSKAELEALIAAIEQAAKENGIPFAEAMRLAEVLQGLRHPDGLAQIDPGAGLNATLRPYQQASNPTHRRNRRNRDNPKQAPNPAHDRPSPAPRMRPPRNLCQP